MKIESRSCVPPEKTDTSKNNCGSCKWWSHVSACTVETPRGEESLGHCHGSPPLWVDNIGWCWPNTGENAWCGQYRKKK
jgi:hypothetical protein